MGAFSCVRECQRRVWGPLRDSWVPRAVRMLGHDRRPVFRRPLRARGVRTCTCTWCTCGAEACGGHRSYCRCPGGVGEGGGAAEIAGGERAVGAFMVGRVY